MRMRMGDRGGWVTAAALVVILLGAAAARFIDLSTNPGGLFPDEAAEALSAQRILHEHGYLPVLIRENGGREALFDYVVAGAFWIGGESALILRGTSAMFGVLGVFAIWLLCRRFGREQGLAAAAWAAGALWLICMSRVGFRAITIPFFGAFALLALVAWYERPTRWTAGVAGALGAVAALYTYQPLRLLPLVLLLWLLWVRRADPERFQLLKRSFIAFGAIFLLTGLPMLIAAASDPSLYLGRAIGVTPFNPSLIAEDPVSHTIRTLGLVGFTGDPNPRHNVDELPAIVWPVALVALVGVRALWRQRAQGRCSLVLLSLVVFFLPPVIATEGSSPHFLRAAGLAVPLSVTIGVGSAQIAAWISRRLATGFPTPIPAAATIVIAAAAFGVLGAGSANAYFSRSVVERYAAFSYPLAALAELAHGPTDVAILDEFDAYSVTFLGGIDAPRIVSPGVTVDPEGLEQALALSLDDLRNALGDSAAQRARPVAWDPLGQPAVWAVTLR